MYLFVHGCCGVVVVVVVVAAVADVVAVVVVAVGVGPNFVGNLMGLCTSCLEFP